MSSQSIGYTIENCKDAIQALEEAEELVKKHPERYDVESTLGDIQARIEKWKARAGELALKA